jgi:hypothetical protein
MGGLKGGKIVNDEENRAKIEAAAKLVRRIEQGDSADVTGSEALARFGVVAAKLPPDELEAATEQELNKLPEDQRVEFGKLLQGAGQIDADVDVTDVRALARATSTGSSGGAGIAGLLGGLLGGSGAAQGGSLDVGSLLGGLLGGGGSSSSQSAGGLDMGGLLGGLLGGGGSQSGQAAGGPDLGGLLGGLLGGGGGGQSSQSSGGRDVGGMLGGLLGGGSSDAQSDQNAGGLDIGSLINNPLVKSVIAGIAGNGMQKVVGNAGGIDNLLGGLMNGEGSAPTSSKEDDGELPNPKKGVVA